MCVSVCLTVVILSLLLDNWSQTWLRLDMTHHTFPNLTPRVHTVTLGFSRSLHICVPRSLSLPQHLYLSFSSSIHPSLALSPSPPLRFFPFFYLKDTPQTGRILCVPLSLSLPQCLYLAFSSSIHPSIHPSLALSFSPSVSHPVFLSFHRSPPLFFLNMMKGLPRLFSFVLPQSCTFKRLIPPGLSVWRAPIVTGPFKVFLCVSRS